MTMVMHSRSTFSGSDQVLFAVISRSSVRPSPWLHSGISWTKTSESVSSSNLMVRKCGMSCSRSFTIFFEYSATPQWSDSGSLSIL